MAGSMFEGTERYRVIRELGSGAYGTVFEAEDRELKRCVALKTLTQLTGSALFAFKREFRRFADLRHPNLVELYELEQHEGTLFYTMELVDDAQSWLDFVRPAGGEDVDRSPHAPTLESLSDTRRAFDEARLRDSLSQLRNALGAVHEAGFVHRDIKPANVLVDTAGCLKLVDFGIAGAAEGSDHTKTAGGFKGTPAYMAPEQSGGGAVTPASDWYAVGVMVYQALTGELPFDGAPLQVLTQKIGSQGLTLPAGPDVPEDLAEFVRGVIVPDAAKRARAIALVARSGTSSSPPSRAAEAPLCVGRDDELGALSALMTESHGSRGSTLALLSGVSGMGKSTVLRRFQWDVERRGGWVFSGRSNQREAMPFKALDPVIDAIGQRLESIPPIEATALLPRNIRMLSRLFPALLRVPAIAAMPEPRSRGGSAGEDQSNAAHALGELLSAMADRRPVALVFDDAQWADLDSVHLVAMMLRLEEPPPVLLLCAAREEEVHTSVAMRALGEMDEFEGIERVTLGPLSRKTSVDLCRALQVERDDALAESVAELSEGSPFFIEQLVRLAVDTESGEKSLGLDGLVEARLEGVEPASRSLLQILAVAGRPVGRDLLAAAAIRSASEVETGLDELLGRGLARRVGQRGELAEVYHDRIREAVLELLETRDRVRLHSALAEAMVGTETVSTEHLFAHLAGAERWSEALPVARRAAREAHEGRALGRAASILREALEIADRAGIDAADIWEELAHVLSDDMRSEAAIAALEEAERTTADEAVRERLRGQRAVEIIAAGRLEEGLELARPILRPLGIRVVRGSFRRALWMLVRAMQLALLRALPFLRGCPPADDPARADIACRAFVAAFTHDIMTSASLVLEYAVFGQRSASERDSVRGRCFALAAKVCMMPSGLTRLGDLHEAHIELAEVSLLDRCYASVSHGVACMANGLYGFGRPYLMGERFGVVPCPGDGVPQRTMAQFRLVSYERSGELRRVAEACESLERVARVRGDAGQLRFLLPYLPYVELLGEAPRAPLPALETDHLVTVVARERVQQLVRRYRRLSPAGRHGEVHEDVRWLLAVRPIINDGRIADSLMAAERGGPLPSSWALWRHSRSKTVDMQVVARVYIAGKAFLLGRVARSIRDLYRALDHSAIDEVHHIAASARLHLSRLLADSDPAAAEAARTEAMAYFEEQGVVDPVRFALTFAPGFRDLYPERPDLDVPLEHETSDAA